MQISTWIGSFAAAMFAQADTSSTDAAQLTAEDAAQGAGGLTLESAKGIVDPENLTRLLEQYGLPVIKALLLLIAAYLFAGWAKSVSRKAMLKSRMDQTLTMFLSTLIRWVILILAGISLLGMFGVETASFAAVIGGMALALGLAFQGTLGNLASGVMLLIFRPFKVGDFVEVSGVRGKVDEIGLFATTLDTYDNRRFIIPNGSVFGSTIENVTYHSVRRVDVSVGVSYEADIDATRATLMKAARSVEKVDASREPAVALTGLGGSSVDWAVRVWVSGEHFGFVKEGLVRAIKVHLDDARIGIPYPQMDVHVFKPDGTL